MTNNKTAHLCFFIGTDAELVKMFPVIMRANLNHIHYKVISSGQNDITKSAGLYAANGGKVDCTLSSEQSIKKSAVGLLQWFFTTKKTAVKKIANDLTDVDFTKSIMVVHGDTVSTFMGALIGKRLKMKIAHVEAGLRSHDIFNPFPEEIDRILTSRRTDIHFAPGDVPCENLKGKHNVVNTRLNTIYDSLQYSYKIPCKNDLVKQLNGQEYFVFVLHRQENLMQKELVESIVNSVINISKQMKCVIILHKPTEIALAELGILQDIENNEQFYTTPRMEYFDFMKLLANSQFVITDGGSNQEELYYMGKPCLILRKSTERNEGIGINAVMYGGNIDWIRRFSEDYPNYIKNPIIAKTPPSDIIYEKLVEVLQGDI